MALNKDLRIRIAEMVKRSGEGHIPSSYSIVDVVEYLYGNVLKYKTNDPKNDDRDYFILSKGHGCGALYVVLHKFGFLSDDDILDYSTERGILGGHPDMTKVPGVEASTGSLGHGFPMAVGLAIGLKILKKKNRVFVLVGDGECHEGTIWEAANVANNLRLGNLCAIVDWNKSAAQLQPRDELPKKWEAFGWRTTVMDGHSEEAFRRTFSGLDFLIDGDPKVVVAETIKGKGVSFIEGHGPWHHRVPSEVEFQAIVKELSL
jgi:transketolase